MPDPNSSPASGGMLCPACRVNLVMTERQGVEIDYCPTCRGVWLDRGELDKILERSVAATGPTSQAPATGYPTQPAAGMGGYGGYGHHDEHHGGHHRRRSFLHDIFG